VGRRVVGREAELSAVARFIDSTHEGFAVLALEGEPGIGKTTVWQEAIREAELRGHTAISCCAASSETRLSFAGLGDLLSSVSSRVLAALPGPQRRALEVALLRSDAQGSPPDQRTISVAFLSLVRALATGALVLVAVDDAQWLDSATAAVLAFTARRLDREPIRMLASIRLADLPTVTFDHAAGERRQIIRVGPLSVAALHELIKERLGRSFARPTLLKIARASGGNPFFALEIARALIAAGEPRPGDPLPIPDDLRKLVRSRLRVLPAGCQEALLAASALSAPTSGLVDVAALAPAEAADVVRVTSDHRIEFTHPLFASAVYASTPAETRRDLHRRLAELVEDVEERGRHLALAAAEPDEAVAAALEAAAAEARGRGAWEAAAELLERARSLTPTSQSDEARRRGVEAAAHYAAAGDRRRARELLQALLVEDLPRPLRARALFLLGDISYNDLSLIEAGHQFDEALRNTDDAGFAATVECGLAYVDANLADWTAGVVHAHRSLELAEAAGETGTIAQALGYCAMFDFLAGRGVDWEVAERAVAVEDRTRFVPLQWRPHFIHALLVLYVGRLSEARELLLAARTAALERGEESDLGFLGLWLSWLETLAGNFDAALAHADDAVLLSSLTGSPLMQAWSLMQRAFVSAHRGDVAGTRQCCAEALALGDFDNVILLHWPAASIGLLELSLGNAEAAWAACADVVEGVEATGILEPVPLFFLPTALEAMIEVGEAARAAAVLDVFEQRARELDRAWALATGARCRGLLFSAQGDLARAEDALQQALHEHERLEMPFELARTLLCLGQTQRRRKQRKAARATLQQALDLFETLGAPLWAEKARVELERTHVREAPQELSPTEEQIARLAASGLKTREVAARLFLSPKTVEANLARAYRKLGIHSRAELGAAMLEREPARNS
jgi:DNA-binding CsgD family transcriptional regulator